MEYMTLAKTYLECGEPKLSLKCLIQSKEFRLCAELCKKLGKVLNPYHITLLFLLNFFLSCYSKSSSVFLCHGNSKTKHAL